MKYDLDRLSDVMAQKIGGRGNGKTIADAFFVAHYLDFMEDKKVLIITGHTFEYLRFFNRILIDVLEFLEFKIQTQYKSEIVIEDPCIRIIFIPQSSISQEQCGYNAEIYKLHGYNDKYFTGEFVDHHSLA